MKYFPERENYENLSSKKTPGPLQPSSICKDVPHPWNSLDVLYDPLYTSQVIEKWRQKLNGQMNLAQFSEQLKSTAIIQIALRCTMKLRSFSGSQSFILHKFTLLDAF